MSTGVDWALLQMVRALVTLLCCAAACLPVLDQHDATRADRDGGGSTGARLVVASLNTHSFQEGADSLAKLDQIGAGLAALGVDMVGLNEVMSGTFWSYDYAGAVHDGTALIRTALERESGALWHAASFGFAHWDTGEEMANVVLSRFPIVEQRSRALTTTDFWPAPGERRNAGFVQVEAPALGLVNFFVTHAWGWDSADTEAQIAEVKSFMDEARLGDEALSLVVGDLNTPSGSSAHESWLSSPPLPLIDTYVSVNPAGAADPTTTDGEDRIDYILAAASDLAGPTLAIADSQLAFDGLAHAGLTLPVVSDHFAVVTTFEAR